jgi:hypothetical protein
MKYWETMEKTLGWQKKCPQALGWTPLLNLKEIDANYLRISNTFPVHSKFHAISIS